MINIEMLKSEAKDYLYKEIDEAGKLLFKVYEMGYWDGRTEIETCCEIDSFKKCRGSSFMLYMDENLSELMAKSFRIGINVVLTMIAEEEEKAKRGESGEK